MALSSDRKRLALATTTQSGKHSIERIDLWDTATWEVVASTPLGSSPIRCLGFSADGSLLAGGDEPESCTFLTWQMPSLSSSDAFRPISDLVFSSDARHLITGGNDCNVHVWHVASLQKPKQTVTNLVEGPHAVRGTTFVDTTVAAVADSAGNVDLWDTSTGERTKRFQVDNGDANMVQIAVSANRRLLGVTCGHWPPLPGSAGKVVIIDLESGTIQSTHSIQANPPATLVRIDKVLPFPA